MRVLGIDPGYAIVGYGIVDYVGNRFKTVDYGAVLTDSKTIFTSRIGKIYSDLTEIFNSHKIDAVAIEKLFFNTNTTTAIDVAQARGVILLAAHNSGVPVYEYTPLQVKQAVTGFGRAEKKQVMEMTRLLLNLDKVPKPDDTADALALAICHAHSCGSMLGKINDGGRI